MVGKLILARLHLRDLFVDQFLLSLYVFEHKLALEAAKSDEGWEYFVVRRVKCEGTGKALLSLWSGVPALEVLRLVVKDEVVFEDGDQVPRLVVHYVGSDLAVEEILGRKILKSLLQNRRVFHYAQVEELYVFTF